MRRRARARARVPPAACALAALVVCAACGGRGEVRILDGNCAFGEERTLAIPSGPVVHDVALAASGERAWAVWSERAGVFARALDASGEPAAEALRIGPACEGGLAAAAREGELVVVCGRRGSEGHDDDGGVQVVAIRDARIATLASFGALGSDGEGVALAVSPAGELHVGWQEAHGAVREAWGARIGPDGAVSAPERLSTPHFRASRPSLLWSGERLLAAWSETWLDARGEPEGRLQVRAGTRAARGVEAVAFDDPLPVLREGVSGDEIVAFRDRRPARSRPRAQLARLRDRGAALERVEAGSPANAEGESLALACGDDVFVVAPRTHSRTERLVSVRRYSRELVGQGPELQLYEHGAAYEHADARCVAGHLVVLFASRRSRVHANASVRAVPVACRGQDPTL